MSLNLKDSLSARIVLELDVDKDTIKQWIGAKNCEEIGAHVTKVGDSLVQYEESKFTKK